MTRSILVATLTAGLLVLVACETAPLPEGELSRARAAIRDADADPNVAKYASTEIERARRLLADAEQASQQRRGHDATEHYAYLATQMARIAGQRSREQVALQRVAAGETERQHLIETLPTSGAAPAHESLPVAHLAETERGLVLTLEDGTFDKDRAVIKPAARRGLDALARFLNENPGRRVQIEAFTDAEGSSVYNLELSQDRADAVAMAVIDRGVTPARVRAIGWGEKYPTASNDDEGGRGKNRRVEITVSNGDAAVPVRVVNAP
ncbi:MAG TPA: OmpA family protein [Steroidobacteraceae bacterium]|nr:OmpA family protein [Steroidobacteraceae bacterium]